MNLFLESNKTFLSYAVPYLWGRSANSKACLNCNAHRAQAPRGAGLAATAAAATAAETGRKQQANAAGSTTSI